MPTFKIKNISDTDLTEPYFHTEIKAGQTVELDSKLATRMLAVFPYRTKIVSDDGSVDTRVGSRAAAKSKAVEAPKAEEEETKKEKDES